MNGTLGSHRASFLESSACQGWNGRYSATLSWNGYPSWTVTRKETAGSACGAARPVYQAPVVPDEQVAQVKGLKVDQLVAEGGVKLARLIEHPARSRESGNGLPSESSMVEVKPSLL